MSPTQHKDSHLTRGCSRDQHRHVRRDSVVQTFTFSSAAAAAWPIGLGYLFSVLAFIPAAAALDDTRLSVMIIWNANEYYYIVTLVSARVKRERGDVDFVNAIGSMETFSRLEWHLTG